MYRIKIFFISLIFVCLHVALYSNNLNQTTSDSSDCLGISIQTENKSKRAQNEEILFGGTSLAYSPINVPPGHLVVEQIFLISRIYGHYDQNLHLQKNPNIFQYQYLPYIKLGIVKNLDFNLITSLIYSYSQGHRALSSGDTIALFGLQLMKAEKNNRKVDMKLLVGESFPTGKHDDLDFNMNGGDGVGTGAFETTLILSVAKVFPINKKHAVRLNPNIYYFIPSSVKSTNFGVYGGVEGQDSVVKPGNKIAFDFPLEYNLTNHLVVGLDIFYIYKGKITSKTSLPGLPASENFSLMPCIEYTPNQHFGISGGFWFSVNGRNSPAFTTGSFLAWWYF